MYPSLPTTVVPLGYFVGLSRKSCFKTFASTSDLISAKVGLPIGNKGKDSLPKKLVPVSNLFTEASGGGG